MSIDEKCEVDASGTEAEIIGCYYIAARATSAEVTRELNRDLRIAAAEDKRFNAFAHAHPIICCSSLVAQMKAGQAAWRKYSHSQCAFEGGVSHGGSGTDYLDYKCHCRLNLRRISELRAAAKLYWQRSH